MTSDLIKIKEKYGEKMMHLCRELFTTLLEEEGLLFKLLSDNFYYSKFLFDDIVNNKLVDKFKYFIYNLNTIEKKDEIYLNESPFKLMNDAGYDLYECKTDEDIKKFRKYYANREELCTFRTNRLETCYVFFAVKKDVNKIERKNFENPNREDEYGTSVISIQFTKGKYNMLSIKNRYNHTVINPDATFSNNLENIIPGLTKSFEIYYNLNINSNSITNFEIPGYVRTLDGKFYKYNYEINNIYYCPDNIIIKNFKVDKSFCEKEKYIIMDYFIVDLVNKKIYLYDPNYIKEISFLETFNNIKKIEISKTKESKEKELKFIFDDYQTIIKLDKCNKIISYKSNIFTSLKDNFLMRNNYLEEIVLDKVYEIGNNFIVRNQKVKSISVPEVIKIGDNFLRSCIFLETFVAENLNILGDCFLLNVKNLKEFRADNLFIIGGAFLRSNQGIKRLSFPNLRIIHDSFMYYNYTLEEIYIPNIEKIGNGFLTHNNELVVFNAPNLKHIGDNFMSFNNSLKEFKVPILKKIGDNCLDKNKIIEDIVFPKIEKKSKFFGLNNNNLKKILNKKRR